VIGPALARFRELPQEQRMVLLGRLPEAQRVEILTSLEALDRIRETNLILRMFPETGPFSRDRYAKHIELYELGLAFQFRCLLGGNGVGKTQCAGIEMVYHLTGDYPEWWPGYRFNRPIKALAAGDTKETVRDIIQMKLMGPEGEHGTGLIPASRIGKVVVRQNGNGAIDFVKVKHCSGKWSTLYFKSYDQGRKTFQGQERDFIWLDEECDMDIYQECVQRFRGSTADGRLLLTFTPLNGVTDVVKMFVPQFAGAADDEEGLPRKQAGGDNHSANRAYVFCSWDDIPHMSERERERKLENTMAYEREARTKGIPTVGRGRIFTVEEDFFLVAPFRIPVHWPKIYGADFGFGSKAAGAGTGVVWGAWDQENDVLYIYDEYFRAEAAPAVHATAIMARGEWIPGVGDYAGRDLEGRKTLDIYRELGLDLINAEKQVYAGLVLMSQLFEEGRLRVFSTCQKWLQEYRLYSLDDKNQVIKKRDHLMDATRYLVMADRRRAKTKPIPKAYSAGHKPETFGLY